MFVLFYYSSKIRTYSCFTTFVRVFFMNLFTMELDDMKAIRQNLGLTQSELADKLGVTVRSIQNYEAGREIPNSIKKLIPFVLYPENTNDNNEQLINEPNKTYLNSDSISLSYYSELSTPTTSAIMYVPLVQKYAYGGYLNDFGDDEYVTELPKIPFVVENRTFKGKYMAFEVLGDSMDNGTIESYPSGCVVLGRSLQPHHWQNKLHIRKWDFVIVHREKGILLKRIKDHDINTGMLTLESLNDIYDDFQVHVNDVVQIFNIVKKLMDPIKL